MKAKAEPPTAEVETRVEESGELPPKLEEVLAVTPRRPEEEGESGFGALGLAVLIAENEDGSFDLRMRGRQISAKPAPTLSAAVLKTALSRGEPVLVERQDDGKIAIVGALRTQATPGIDEMEEIHLEADRVHLRGRKEVSLSTSGAAQIALRAIGEVETYANRIVSRAEEVHKIVGRMLRLN